MAKAKVSKATKKKTDANSAPKSKLSGVQKASQALPASQGPRRSERQKKESSRAQEAAAIAPPLTKKPKTGLKSQRTEEPSKNAEAGPSVNTITNAPPPTKKPKTGLKSQRTVEPSKDADAGPSVDTITNAPSPTKKPKTGLKSQRTVEPSKDADAGPSVDTITNAPPPTKKPETGPAPKPTQRPQREVNNLQLDEVIQDAIKVVEDRSRSHPFESVKPGPQKEKRRHPSKDAPRGRSKDTTKDTVALASTGKAKSGPKDAVTRESSNDVHTEHFDHADADTNAPPARKKAKTNEIWERGSGTSDNAEAESPNQDASTGTVAGLLGPETTTQRLRQEGWDSPHFPEDFRRCYVPDSRIPSPFLLAFGDRLEEVRDVLETYPDENVTRLWCRARTDREQVMLRMLRRNAVSDDGRYGRFCALAHVGADNVDEDPNHDGSGIIVYGGAGGEDVPFNIELNALKPDTVAANTMDAYKTLHVRRLINNQTNEYGYFIVNPNLEFLAVNESAVSPQLIAGPLPEFAVITIEDVALFWFRTQLAIDGYLPEPRVSAGSKRKRTSLPPVTWEMILREGLEDSRRLYREGKFTIGDAANMTLDDVWVAIGSIWEGLRSGTPKTSLDAYAGIDLFYPPDTLYYSPMPDPVAGLDKPFIMPILFAAEKDMGVGEKPKALNRQKSAVRNKKGKGKGGPAEKGEELEVDEVGHLLLAVAQVVESKRGKREAQVDIYDSSVNEAAIDRGQISDRVHDLVERARWPRPNEAFAALSFYHHRVPQQLAETNTCGLYTILNAWAVMLGIPIRRKRPWRPTYSTQEEFVRDGLEIVNLALAGFMRSRTIQAFLNVHGYSEDQDPTDAGDTAVSASAVAMEHVRLLRKLNSQRHVDQGVSEGRSVSPDEETPPGSPVAISEENVDTLITLGATREAALIALTRSRNNLGAAAGIIIEALPNAHIDGSAQLEGSQSSGLTSLGESESSEGPGPSSSGQPGDSRDAGPSSSSQPGSSLHRGVSTSWAETAMGDARF